jgi:hypothetical protein
MLGLITLGHLRPLIFGWGFVVHETVVPMWPSVVVVLVFAFVAVMLWRDRGEERPEPPEMWPQALRSWSEAHRAGVPRICTRGRGWLLRTLRVLGVSSTPSPTAVTAVTEVVTRSCGHCPQPVSPQVG